MKKQVRYALAALAVAPFIMGADCNPFRPQDPRGLQDGVIGNVSQYTIVMQIPDPKNLQGVVEWRFNPNEWNTFGMPQGRWDCTIYWEKANGREVLAVYQFIIDGHTSNATFRGGLYPWVNVYGYGALP